MTSRLALFFHFCNVGIIINGVIYYFLRYFFKIETQYGLRPHTLEPWMKYLHIVLSALFIFSIGTLWKDHIWPLFKKSAPSRKISGLVLFFCLFPLALSGYLIQFSLVSWSDFLHLALSLIWIFASIIHFRVEIVGTIKT